MSTEYLDIPQCPKCGDGHRYKLDVTRSIVLKMLRIEDMHERPRPVRITRLFTCPVKDEEFQASFVLTDTSSDRIESVSVEEVSRTMTKMTEVDTTIVLEKVQDISPHNKALYEAGKTLLIQSVEVGREFCKFMTTTVLASIPAYIALLKLVLPEDHSLHLHEEVILLVPPILFLLSSIIFVIGYFPQKCSFSLDVPSEIERERSKTIKHRQRLAIWAFALFCLGVTLGCYLLVGKLSI